MTTEISNPTDKNTIENIKNDEYHESEDEDFKPDDIIQESDDESDNDHEPSESKQALDKKYQSIQGEELSIKTRSQRREDQLKEKEYKTVNSNVTIDVDDIWKQLNEKTDKKSQSKSTIELPTDEYIIIRRKYQFAGKIQEEEKRVLVNSAEAKAYLAEQKQPDSIKRQASDSIPLKKRPAKKKKSFLQDELNAAKAQKMNTLQKSKLDWASFVDQEGIKDDLTKHNKGGYLHKQDFLSRVEHNLDEKRKDAMRKGE